MFATRAILLAPLILAACGPRAPGPGGEPRAAPVATGELRNRAGEPVGIASFTAGDTESSLAISVSGLPPGRKGIHIHENGECTPPDFESAGAHFNPGGRQHGLENPEGAHAGDLPNLEVGEDGSADVTFSIAAELLRPGDRSVIGAALVIHAQPDDQRTDPSGNSGDRIVCGVIKGG